MPRIPGPVPVLAVALAVASCSAPPTAVDEPPGSEPADPSPDLRAEVLFHQSCPSVQFPEAKGGAPAALASVPQSWSLGESGAWRIAIRGAGAFPEARIRFEMRAPDGRPTIWWRTVSLVSPRPGRSFEMVFEERNWAPADTGFYALSVTIDPDAVYAELDEWNNLASDTVRVLPPWFGTSGLDLYAPSVSELGATVVPAGTPVQLIGRMFCEGGYASLRRVVTVDGAAVLDVRSAVTAGCWPGFAIDSVTWRATPGTHRVEYAIDPGHEHERLRPWFSDGVARTLVVEP